MSNLQEILSSPHSPPEEGGVRPEPIILYLGESGFDNPYGFLIFRTTYGDDEKWEQFMAYLKAQAKRGLEDGGDSHQFERIDWNVISSPDLDGASVDHVRE